MTRSKILHEVLQDNQVVTYLLKHEKLIVDYFNVPFNCSPKTFIIELANETAAKPEYPQYHVSPIYTNLMATCKTCNMSLKIKKAMNASLYDDVLGTLDICILSKYCNECKVTYFPTYEENYLEKKRIYMEDWRRYGIFMCTGHTSYSIDFMERSVCLKLKCHTSFIGRSDAFNHQWRYKNTSERKMDKRTFGTLVL